MQDIYHPEVVRSTRIMNKEEISEYVVVPKNVSGSKKTEILVAHPTEGFIILKDDQQIHATDLVGLADVENEPFGKLRNTNDHSCRPHHAHGAER